MTVRHPPWKRPEPQESERRLAQAGTCSKARRQEARQLADLSAPPGARRFKNGSRRAAHRREGRRLLAR